MAVELDGLLARVNDPALGADLRAQIDRIRAELTFGMVFESHLPERVRLPEHPVRPGAAVTLRDDPTGITYQVVRARVGKAIVRAVRHPDKSRLSAEAAAEVIDEELPVADLVVVAEFGEPIYPGLRTLDSIERGGDKPAGGCRCGAFGGRRCVWGGLRRSPRWLPRRSAAADPTGPTGGQGRCPRRR